MHRICQDPLHSLRRTLLPKGASRRETLAPAEDGSPETHPEDQGGSHVGVRQHVIGGDGLTGGGELASVSETADNEGGAIAL